MPRHPGHSAEARLGQSVFAGLAGKLARRNGPSYPLHIGDACFAPAADYQAAVPTAASLGRYGNPAGDPALVAALVEKLRRRNDVQVTPEAVQVTVGATHALACASRAVLGAGDECLLLAPYWPLIRGMVTLCGATPIEVPFYDALDGRTDVTGLLRPHLSDHTAALYLTNPNNPDGTVAGRAVLESLVAFAGQHDLWVLADECYEQHVYEGEHVSIASLPGGAERVLCAYSFSKSHSLAGLRLGYLVGPPPTMATVRRVSNHTVYNAPAGAQAVAFAALERGDGYLADQRDRARRARDRVLATLRVPHRVPAGGAYVFLDLRGLLGGRRLDELLEACVQRGVLLAPGEAFGAAYAGWARLCFTACPEDELAQAVAIVNEVVASF